MLKEATLYAPISELAKQIEAKALSPVEFTERYLARSERLGPKLNAYAKLLPDQALEQARAAEKEIHRGHYRGPLHGIPYAAKDLLAVKGIPTTWGAKPFADQVFDYNATVVDHLKNTGAILLGKAAMIELARGMGYKFASASLQGEAKNPWNTGCWTCGSSSGSGAIVAAVVAGADLVVTTGGTGLGPRDVTPQATSMLIDYEVPGISELMRRAGMESTPMAMLSRGLAGVRGQTLEDAIADYHAVGEDKTPREVKLLRLLQVFLNLC